MNSGRHSAGPSSSGPALGRGLLLLVVAVVVGIVILRSVPTPVPPGGTTSTTAPSSTASTQPPNNPLAAGPPVTTASLPPSKITVLVANGTTVPAGAGNLRSALQALGYNLLLAYDTTAPAASSAIYYATSTYKQSALTLATLLGQPASLVAALPSTATSVQLTTTAGANVVIIEGPTLAQRFASPVTLHGSGQNSSTTTTTTTTSTTQTTQTTSGG